MCKGLAHGEEERRIIPADSMAANSFLVADWMPWIFGEKTFGGDNIRIFGQEIAELFRGRKESSIET